MLEMNKHDMCKKNKNVLVESNARELIVMNTVHEKYLTPTKSLTEFEFMNLCKSFTTIMNYFIFQGCIPVLWNNTKLEEAERTRTHTHTHTHTQIFCASQRLLVLFRCTQDG